MLKINLGSYSHDGDPDVVNENQNGLSIGDNDNFQAVNDNHRTDLGVDFRSPVHR